MSLSELYEVAENVTFGPAENRALEEKLREIEHEANARSKIMTEEFLSRSYSL
ncbi:TPA: hypothetical protein ACNFPD_003437 [Enterobacter cancerogenus]|uniref:hypothetical protein n=1 Tax=Enterobacteriaceae TaxID=543 RepID=UPI0013046187|nr:MULTISPECIES: hypothetical protein [Enterobacteriaceae]MBH2879401.1 hypothetical protein [Serratia marcescens]HCI6284269.1 hypothetical protein [Klebsiella quasipneumoniae subsp. similipneumoniae]HCT5788440.1 hypothetical protein [Klebsiella variicola]MBK0710358.1 hypothetical protein [Klebsiella pneumoniae]MBM2683268.1 hypothetical protein [Klebsiella pneumoniae]